MTDKKRTTILSRGLEVVKPPRGRPSTPVEVTYAFLAITAGAGLSVITSIIGLLDVPWDGLKAATVVVVAVTAAGSGLLLIGLPVVAALCAAKGRRWPVVLLTFVSVFLLATIGFAPALDVISTLLTVLGCVLLWLPKSRAYSKSISSQRQNLRRR